MGMLHTLHDFRRRGYAALVVRALASKIIQDGAVPFCHIVEGNTSSLALFRSLGFEEPQPEERFDWYIPSQVPFPLRLIVTLWSGTISAGKLIDVSPPFSPPPPSAALRSMQRTTTLLWNGSKNRAPGPPVSYFFTAPLASAKQPWPIASSMTQASAP